MGPKHMHDHADQLETLSFSVRDGWQEEADRAGELLCQAAALMRTAAWVQRVRALLLTLELSNEYLYEDSEIQPSHLSYGERTLYAGTFAIHRRQYVGCDSAHVHLTVATVDEADRCRVIDALAQADGIVDGWNGSLLDFEEAHSVHGYISVKVGNRRHPMA